MLNPFKKKDNEFKLDEEPLPSLGPEIKMENEVPTPSLSQDNSFNTNPSFDAPNQFPEPTIAGGTGSFNSPNNTIQQDNNNMSYDLLKTKMESLDSKITLMEAKMSNIENKLEMIYQIMLNEVSDETKKKIKVGKMMDTIKGN